MAWRWAHNTVLTEEEKKEVTELFNTEMVGKWMPFTPPERVRGVWADIVEATEAGRLGHKAKVATDHRPGKDVLICVYTKDHRDRQDVGRILAELRAMGIDQRLSYKEDAATSALHYGGGAALYVARPGSTAFDQRREAYTSDDSRLGVPVARTVEQVFARPEVYGPFPD